MPPHTPTLRRRVAVCAALVCALAALRAEADADADAEAERSVDEIEWVGAESIPHDELEAAILTESKSWKPWVASRPFEAGMLEEDQVRVRGLYERHGFYKAEVKASYEPGACRGLFRGRDCVDVTFRVIEGPRVLLEKFDIELLGEGVAAAPLSVAELRGGVALVVGEPFSADLYQETKATILERLANRGYPAAQLRGGAEVTLETDLASVSWTLDPGPFVILGPATVTGLEDVAERFVLGAVTWREGDPYSRTVLRSTQRAVFALDVFRSVAVQATPPEPGAFAADAPTQVWPVAISVNERSPRSVRVGVGYGTDDGFRAGVEWKHRNFLGGLRTLRFAGKYSQRESGLETVFVQPRFLEEKTTLTLDALMSQESPPGYETRGASTGWGVERPFGPKWTARLGQRFEIREVTDVEAIDIDISPQENESFRLVFFELGARRSTLDSELDPTRGTWLDFALEPAFSELGSQVSYVKMMLDARAFHPLLWGTVLAGRVRLGTLEPFGGARVADVPIFKRFFSGGATSVRGFKLDELGPRGLDGDPIGGFTLAEGTVELRYPIWRDIGGTVFVDVGQVALGSFSLRGNDFFYTPGFGLRYKTPIGPLRFDVARIVNPPRGVDAWGFHFSVGQAF